MCALVTGVQTCALPICPMGAGKTTVGRRLAELRGLQFIDSDHEIEACTGVDIAYIFEREGEAGFRKRESQMIDELAVRNGIVLATGGGAVLDADSRRVLSAHGYVVYLHASIEQQLHRTGREDNRSEAHTSELQSLMRISYAVFFLKHTT